LVFYLNTIYACLLQHCSAEYWEHSTARFDGVHAFGYLRKTGSSTMQCILKEREYPGRPCTRPRKIEGGRKRWRSGGGSKKSRSHMGELQ